MLPPDPPPLFRPTPDVPFALILPSDCRLPLTVKRIAPPPCPPKALIEVPESRFEMSSHAFELMSTLRKDRKKPVSGTTACAPSFRIKSTAPMVGKSDGVPSDPPL